MGATYWRGLWLLYWSFEFECMCMGLLSFLLLIWGRDLSLKLWPVHEKIVGIFLPLFLLEDMRSGIDAFWLHDMNQMVVVTSVLKMESMICCCQFIEYWWEIVGGIFTPLPIAWNTWRLSLSYVLRCLDHCCDYSWRLPKECKSVENPFILGAATTLLQYIVLIYHCIFS